MPNSQKYKEAMQAYRNGFLLGAFVGIVICVATAKAILSLPLILGMLFGAIGFERKSKEDGNNKQ